MPTSRLTMASDVVTSLVTELGLTESEFNEIVKKAKSKAIKKRPAPSEESLMCELNNTLTDAKISKRLFRGVPLDMSTSYIRDLVNSYYMIQNDRITMGNQKGALERDGKNSKISEYFTAQLEVSEANVQTYLDVWTDRHPIGVWLKAQTGIGPVIAAGILAYFDITKTSTAGGFWRYVGWEGGDKRKSPKKGEKLSYCPKARVLIWKAGSSFKMQSTRESCYYGKLYSAKKQEYLIKNEMGGFAENASRELASKKFSESDTKKTYESGKLPLAHIDSMALRFAAKMFLSHVFDVMYIYEYGEKPPVPFVIAHKNHVHIEPPQHLEVLRPYFEEKWGDRDFDQILFEAYHMRSNK